MDAVEAASSSHPQTGVFNFAPGQLNMSITIPDEDVRCMVTIEQLESLSKGGNDNSFGWFLSFLFAGLGFLQNAFSFGYSYWKASQPPFVDLILSVIFVVCVVGAALKFSEHKRISSDSEKLLEKIKAGKKIPVH